MRRPFGNIPLLIQIAALLAAGLVVLYAAPAQYFGRQHDDALYVIASHAIASGSYRNLFSPGRPPLTMIMPGFPAFLLPVTWLLGESAAAYQFLCALLAAALPGALWWWLRKRLPASSALLAVLIFATSPIFLGQAGTVMSESLYTLLVLGWLVAAEQRRPGRAGAWLLCLSQVRPAGFSLVPAALAEPLRRKDYRGACILILPTGLAALAWYLWCFHAAGEIGEFHELRFSYRGQGWSYPLTVALDNARFYAGELGACFLPGAWAAWGWIPGVALAGLALAGAKRAWSAQSARPAVLMLAGAVVMHALWPWRYDRYLIPILPWVLWLSTERLGRRAAWLLGGLLALQITFHSRLWISGRMELSRPELQETYLWLRAHSRPQDAIASPLYARDGLLCGRPSFPLPDVKNPELFVATLRQRRARFVLWQRDLDIGVSLPDQANLRRMLDSAQRQLEDRRTFRLIYSNEEEGTQIFEVRGDALKASSGSAGKANPKA
jgi:hypothetical protein